MKFSSSQRALSRRLKVRLSSSNGGYAVEVLDVFDLREPSDLVAHRFARGPFAGRWDSVPGLRLCLSQWLHRAINRGFLVACSWATVLGAVMLRE